jgi:translation elongation factor EF-Ts
MSAILSTIETEPDTAQQPRYGRVEAYFHSDSTTQHKGGAMVTVLCDSEAGARTEVFIRFARLTAKMAYASSATCWFDIAQMFPEMTGELNTTQVALGEHVIMTRAVVMKV